METKKNEKVRNAELKAELKGLNVETLVSKSIKNRVIWKADFKTKFSDNEKTARRKIRNEQMRLSKALSHNVLTDQSDESIKESANSLFKFYTDGLSDFAVYTNISITESPEKRDIVDKAYNTMKKVLNK
jgi:hypothetical protein